MRVPVYTCACACVYSRTHAGGSPRVWQPSSRFPLYRAQAALQESLRLNPPGWMTSRECVEDTDIGDWAIPAGSVVYIDIHGIQRSPGEHFHCLF